MMVERKILEALDACRPDSDDLQLPELREAAAQVAEDAELAQIRQRIARLDAQIAQAMHEVAPPEGLAERLLARLHAQAEQNQASEGEPSPAANVELAPAAKTISWRRLAATLAVAAAVAIGASLALLRSAPPALTPTNIEELAEVEYNAARQNAAWESIDSAPRSAYPISSRVAARARQWKSLDSAYDAQAVAYDLTPLGSKYQATLMVLRTNVPGLTTIPEKEPLWTQGRLISAWQQGDLLYVLVLEAPPGGARNLPNRYRQLVDTSAGIVG